MKNGGDRGRIMKRHRYHSTEEFANLQEHRSNLLLGLWLIKSQDASKDA